MFAFWALRNTGVCRTMFKIAEIFRLRCVQKCWNFKMYAFWAVSDAGALEHTGFSRMSGFLS